MILCSHLKPYLIVSVSLLLYSTAHPIIPIIAEWMTKDSKGRVVNLTFHRQMKKRVSAMTWKRWHSFSVIFALWDRVMGQTISFASFFPLGILLLIPDPIFTSGCWGGQAAFSNSNPAWAQTLDDNSLVLGDLPQKGFAVISWLLVSPCGILIIN